MGDIVLLRFDAPLVSFGAPIVDNLGVVQPWPALSMLAGLLANALGWDHRDFERTQRLQERIRYAARADWPGVPLRDYQTADLGQDFLVDDNVAWTTLGRVEKRKGGPASRGTHIRQRDYHADGVYTVAIELDPADEPPRAADLEAALREPERPLFVGRKCCLPAGPVLLGRVAAASPLAALCRWPRAGSRPGRTDDGGPLAAWWSDGDPAGAGVADRRRLEVTDERDWRNQLHCGLRPLWHGRIQPGESAHGDGTT